MAAPPRIQNYDDSLSQEGSQRYMGIVLSTSATVNGVVWHGPMANRAIAGSTVAAIVASKLLRCSDIRVLLWSCAVKGGWPTRLPLCTCRSEWTHHWPLNARY